MAAQQRQKPTGLGLNLAMKHRRTSEPLEHMEGSLPRPTLA